jgi:CHAD domain-containing protein
MLRETLGYLYRMISAWPKTLVHGPSIGVNMKSSLNRLIEQGLLLKETKNLSVETKIHELRKSVKRSRAMLKILKSHIAAKSFNQLDENLKDAAYDLTVQRESTVNGITFIELCANAGNRITPQIRKKIDDYLTTALENAYANSNGRMDLLVEKSFRNLRSALQTLNEIQIGFYPRSNLLHILETVYAKVCKLFRDACVSRDMEVVHKWRRYTKYLMHQLEYTPHLFRADLRVYLSSLNRIAELLGKDHDLAVLENYIVKNNILETDEWDQLKAVIGHERNTLLNSAIELGNTIFSETTLVSAIKT